MTEAAFDHATAGWHDIAFRAASRADRTARNLVVALTDGSESNRARLSALVSDAFAAQVVGLMEAGQVSTRYKDFTLLRGAEQAGAADWDWVLLLGLGDLTKVRRSYRLHDRLRSVSAIAARHFQRMNLLSFASSDYADLDVAPEQAASLIAEGIQLGLYRFERYKSAPNRKYPDQRRIETVTVLTDSVSEARPGAFARGVSAARGAHLARNLVNTPAKDLWPGAFADYAKAVAQRFPGLRVEVLDEAAMREERLHLHLAVGQGSQNPPFVVVLEYLPRGEAAGVDLALVGKGVCFDSGGYNLKPTGYIERMYSDMGGGAAVLGALTSIAEQATPLNVVGIIPLAENMVSGQAYRPGDILDSRKGLTVEIVNTDAEGRLLLADALTYACERFAPRHLVDIATLTGSMRVALGNFVSGFFVHSEEPDREEQLAAQLVEAGRITGEWLWRFPVDDDYKVQLSSDVADLENCETDATAGAGAITAAVFLKQFVDFEVVRSWAHIDIAATSLLQRTLIYNKSPYQPKEGATGVGARLLSELARALAPAP